MGCDPQGPAADRALGLDLDVGRQRGGDPD
jgi:hypothetical protein